MNGSTERIVAIRAPWILGRGGEWLENAYIVWDYVNNRVMEVRRGKTFSSAKSVDRFLDVGNRAIIPGLVNAHTHLELSVLSGLFREGFQGNYIGWVKNVIKRRDALRDIEIESAFFNSAVECFRTGTSVIGDVSNKPIISKVLANEIPWRHLFWEWIGFTVEEASLPEEKELLGENKWVNDVSLVPHAVYSTSPFLIKETKNWCKKHGKVFSIHVGETEEEIVFLREGKGRWREFLEEIGKWNGKWNPPGVSPVKYLDALGVLDSHTLLVHCLHLDSEDWDIIAKRRAHVCLCPRSNYELGTGKIPAGEIIRRNIPFLLGTDSLASSPSLNLFDEAVFLLEHYREFSPGDVIKAITGKGRNFFVKTNSFIEPGFKGWMLSVEVSENASLKSLPEEILYNGQRGAHSWVQPSSE